MKTIRPALMLKWAAKALYHTRLIRPLSVTACYARRDAAFQILTYHRVNDEEDPFFPSFPTEIFERHMGYLARGYCVLTVEELAERAVHGTLPRNALAITFDDGYRDNLTHAAPILARHGLPATIFLATGLIGADEILWFDRVALSFKVTKAASVTAPWGGVLKLNCQAERLAATHRMWDYLKGLDDDCRRRTLDNLLATLDITNQDCLRHLMLDWDGVRALRKIGLSIGAHTVNHPILSRITTERAWAEIRESRRMIEAACGHPPRAFAYPNGKPGDYTEAVKQLVRDAGFTCAVTTRFGLNSRKTCLFELRRGGPWEHDLATFALKLAAYRAIAR